jgi:hypothetical protein
MFNSHVLEVVAGLCFIFFVVSVFVSTVNEWLAAVLGLRAKDLETGLKNLLGEDRKLTSTAPPTPPAVQAQASPSFTMATAILAHPLVENVSPMKLMEKKVTGPSYLDAKVFSAALVDLLVPGDGQHTLDELRQAVGKLPNEDLRKALLPLIDRAGGTIDGARKNMEGWFDHAMEHVSGRYKRRAQAMMLLVALAFAILLNIDTVSATSHLWNDPVLREHMLKQEQSAVADGGVCNSAGSDAPSEVAKQREKIKCTAQLIGDAYSESAMPIGWSGDAKKLWQHPGSALTVVLGWLLTALAACLGAPFWFDLLNKTLGFNARLSGAKPKSAEGAAKS